MRGDIMIKSIIFDLGRVLLTFEPEDYVYRLYGKGEKARILYKAVFGSKTWLDLDRGTVDYGEAVRIMSADCEDYAKDIEYLLYNWVEIMMPIEENVDLLKELKMKGYNLYLLSNFHEKAFGRVFEKYGFFESPMNAFS